MTSFSFLRALAVTADLLESAFRLTVAFGVFCFVAGEFAGKAFYAWHSDWIGTEATWPPPITEEPAVAPSPQAPFVSPLAVAADDLMAMTCKQLMALTGSRKKRSKADLIALHLAIAV